MIKPTVATFRLFLFIALMVPLMSASAQSGALVMRIDGVDAMGDVKIQGFTDGNHIAVNALSLSFEREVVTGSTGSTGRQPDV